MKFKTGDVVEVQGVVKWDGDGADGGNIYINISHQTVGVPADEVVLVHQGLKVGDVAIYQPMLNENPLAVEIISIHDKQAWVKGDWDGIVDLYELKRPEPVDEPDDTEAYQPPQPPAPPIGDAGIILPASDEALDF